MIELMDKDSVQVKAWHASMEFSDGRKQKEHDARQLMKRARNEGVWWITGTEAGRGGGNKLGDMLAVQADLNAFRFWLTPESDTWFAVNRDVIKGHTYRQVVTENVIAASHRSHAKSVSSVNFLNPEIGRVNVFAGHFLTQGAKPGQQNYADNLRLATRIGVESDKVARGNKLAFYGGDNNVNFAYTDPFFLKTNFISSWDELGKYPATAEDGARIDVICRHGKDSRVRAKSARVYDDKVFRLNTNHRLVETVFEVKKL